MEMEAMVNKPKCKECVLQEIWDRIVMKDVALTVRLSMHGFPKEEQYSAYISELIERGTLYV